MFYNIKQYDSSSNCINTHLDLCLSAICQESLEHGDAKGLEFVQSVLGMSDLPLERARRKWATCSTLYRTLTPEQIEELHDLNSED